MYKVVIVDDETIIVEGLRRVVDWGSFGCEVVSTASDAAEGARVIRACHPDILFTDIKMPNEDGLTMLAGLKAEFPNLQVTVLTGYRDFDYAQKAIHLGVCRFLLKPSRMDELEEAVRAMVANLDRLGGTAPPSQETGEDPAADTANSFVARQAQGYIAAHYAEKLSLQDVADHCYVSQWHLSKLLHKHLDQNFYDILNGVRIQKAKELLQEPSLRISDIAERVGYADTAHFSRVFKKSEGVSANEWRNLHCGI